jgi:hypothetical protein
MSTGHSPAVIADSRLVTDVATDLDYHRHFPRAAAGRTHST